MPTKTLKSINNTLKIDINEATSIGDKCKNKLVRLVEKHFQVELPHDNYKNIDITILENGNILMREVEYKTEKECSLEGIIQKFDAFQEEVDHLLDTNKTNFSSMKKKNELSNLIIVFLMLIVIIIVGLYSVKQLLLGNLFGVIWIVIMIGSYVVPATGNKFRSRWEQAIRYLKSLFRK